MRTGYKMTKLGEIPVDWEVVNIGSIADVTAGGTPSTREPDYWGGDIPWMNSGEINLRRIKEVEGRITDVGLQNSSTKIMPSNSILMALAGQGKTRGKVAINEIPLCTNQSLATIYNLQNADFEFVFQNLESRYLEIRRMSTGDSGRGGLNLTIIKTIKVALPPLREQKKIAQILTTVDDKIALIDQQLSETAALKKGLMQRLLTKGIGHTKFKDSPLGEIPVGWEVVKLGEVVSKVGSGVTPKGGRESYLLKGITFIRSQNVLRGKLKLDDVAYISDEQHEKMNNSRLSPNDVLLNITGASIGRSCVVPSNFKEGNVNQHVCIIRTDDNFNPYFLCDLLNSSFGKKQIDKFQAGGNREGLNFQQIRSFKIPLPPQLEQEKIALVIRSISNKINVLSEKKTNYKDLKKGLMQQLLTGKIRVK